MFLVRFTVILTRFYPAVVLFMYRLLLCYVNCGFGIKWRRPSLLLIWLNMYRGHLCCLSLLEEATFPCYLVGRIPGKCCLPSSTTYNRPFPSSPRPLYQNEGRCSAFDMEMIFHSHANKTHFHKKGRAPSLILKVRVFGTRK